MTYSRSALTLLVVLSDLYKPVSAYGTSVNTRIRGWSALD